MRAAVVTFPGSNCDRDLAVALEAVLQRPVARVWHGDDELPPVDLVGDDPEWVSILSWQGGLAHDRGLVIDMLSTPYSSFVSLPPGAITVKVWQQGPAGQRTAASHFNKATKGHLTRALATCGAISHAHEVLDVAREAGFDAELDGRRLDVMRVE